MGVDSPVREVRSVLATVMWEPSEIAQLRQAFAPAEFIHVHPGDAAAIDEALRRVDVVIHLMDIDDRFLAAPHLRWVHCDHSGLTRSARPEVFERGIIVSGSAGRSAEALAQHGFYFALALTFDARRLFEMQTAHVWRGIPNYDDRLALWGKTLGVVGLGHTGKAMARLGEALGMRVIGYRRGVGEKPAGVERVLSADDGDSLDPLLEESDVIMLAAPLSNETHHMFSGAQFARMKSGAYFINMARGALVAQDALIEALRTGSIAGAGLDVTDPEPLPDDSPLWDMPNVIITPHMTPKLPERTQRSIDLIVENLHRYQRGEPLLNALSPRDVFTNAPALENSPTPEIAAAPARTE